MSSERRVNETRSRLAAEHAALTAALVRRYAKALESGDTHAARAAWALAEPALTDLRAVARLVGATETH